MESDDFAGVIEAKVVSKRAYNWLVWQMTVPLWMLGFFILLLVRDFFRLDVSLLGSLVFSLLHLLARVCADAILKRRGLSRSGRTVEIWTNPGATSTEDTSAAEPAAVSLAQYDWLIGLGLVLFLIGMLRCLVAAVACDQNLDLWSQLLSLICSVAVMIAVFGSLFFVQAWRGLYCYRVDAGGVTRFPTGKLIPWSAVATCEVLTVSDPTGAPNLITATLKSDQGRLLMEFDLRYRDPEQRRRLLELIQTKLPQPLKVAIGG